MRHAVVALVVLAPAVAGASPTTEFREARDSFIHKDCGSARPKLKDLLDPEQLSDREDLFEAHAMLGACEIEMQQPEEARKQFEQALQLEPDATLDLEFYNPDVVRAFDNVKADLDARRKQEADAQARFMAADALRVKLANLRVYEHHSSWERFVPFGVGQFNNQSYVKGGLFLAGEFVTLGTSFGIWYYLVTTYGVHSSNVPFSQAQTVHDLQGVEIGTGAAFIALGLWGIYDAYRHYQPEVRVPNSDKLLRDLETPSVPAPPSPPTPVKTSLHWGPIVVPNGGGIGLSLETP